MSKEVQVIKESTIKDRKYAKLILGIIFDLVGMISYIFPGIGETIDIIWAPVSGLILASMYKGKVGKIAGVISFIEEAIPFTDIIPTFTLTWVYTYVLNKDE
jgi:hypothetical protein